MNATTKMKYENVMTTIAKIYQKDEKKAIPESLLRDLLKTDPNSKEITKTYAWAQLRRLLKRDHSLVLRRDRNDNNFFKIAPVENDKKKPAIKESGKEKPVSITPKEIEALRKNNEELYQEMQAMKIEHQQEVEQLQEKIQVLKDIADNALAKYERYKQLVCDYHELFVLEDIV